MSLAEVNAMLRSATGDARTARRLQAVEAAPADWRRALAAAHPAGDAVAR